MSNQPPLNPDALGRMFATAMMEVLDAEKLQPGDRLVHVNDMQEVLNRLEKNILAAALPEVTSVPGVYDLGAPEPAGVDHVVECDEFGEPDVRGDSANEPTWSKTTDGTRWKGYKDGKEYRSWADLVRRYGPLTEYRPEVKP